MNIKTEDFNWLVFAAFRYALGRKTYITSTVARIMMDHSQFLHPKDLRKYVTEIQEAIDSGEAGMDMDVEEWVALKKCLQSHMREINKVVPLRKDYEDEVA